MIGGPIKWERVKSKELSPDFSVPYRHYLGSFIFTDEWIEHILEGLVRAGFNPVV